MNVAVGGVLLVVDEDVQRAEHLDGLLTPDGVTVLHARSSGQAVELLHALGKACCIVISMTLPARGGWELLSRLRSRDAPEEACSAIVMGPASLIDCEPAHPPVIARMRTPVDFAQLREMVRAHCAPAQPVSASFG